MEGRVGGPMTLQFVPEENEVAYLRYSTEKSAKLSAYLAKQTFTHKSMNCYHSHLRKKYHSSEHFLRNLVENN